MMHFLTVGDKFPYSYYIGIKSASKVGEVKLWYTKEPSSEYFDSLDVPTEKIEIGDYLIFKGRDPHWSLVSTFDYLMWKIIAENGGSVMGLDSITIKPFDDLLGDADMVVGRDSELKGEEKAYCMHGATCKKDSLLAQAIHEDSEKAMNGEELDGPHKVWRDGYIRFGAAGMIPFLNNIEKHKDLVKVVDFGVLGGYKHDGSPFYLFEDGELLNPDCRTIPFYATWQKDKFNDITPESIKGTLLGRLVERIGI